MLELLVVLAIIGLIIALVPGFLIRDNAGFDVDRATQVIVEELRQTRSASLLQNSEQLFRIDVDRRLFVSGERDIPVQIMRDIDLRFVTARREWIGESTGQIRFFPDGSSTGGRILLAMDHCRSVIEVDWLTGLVSVSNDAC